MLFMTMNKERKTVHSRATVVVEVEGEDGTWSSISHMSANVKNLTLLEVRSWSIESIDKVTYLDNILDGKLETLDSLGSTGRSTADDNTHTEFKVEVDQEATGSQPELSQLLETSKLYGLNATEAYDLIEKIEALGGKAKIV